ncbi:hypothetical protein VTL71DRAFT_16318 [Oculimacula yallundae]|uniref:Heterokaryon incompatibility domain-containing protein n=1 Tax=Oculimacula yallundae TaxID=86028 RepID=A0ABR4CE54_9HELO
MAHAVGSYQYSSLPAEKFIRLLEICPGQANDTVHCTLCQVELENAPKYEAISYAWGNPASRIDVLCDGKIITVTQNLKDALLRLRLKDKSRIVWADAICINQSDEVEKGSQVKLMNGIYAKATRVCAWLGCTTIQMEPAFELIHDMVIYANSTSTLDRTELPDPASECWAALDIFFSAAWFSRLWIVQEVYGHPCMVFCGDHTIPWKDVVLVARLLLDLSFDGPSSAYPLPANTLSVLQIDSAGNATSSSDVFDTFRHFHCSEQRDKVYALLSFPPLCEVRPPIQPDYSKPVAEVFEEAAVRIFLFYQNLGLLSSLEHDSEIDEDWPSWVPRWDRKRTTQVLHMYASGRTTSPLPVMNHRPSILTVKGVRISILSWCGMVIREDPNDKSETDLINIPLQEWLSKYPPRITHPTDPFLLYIAMSLTVGLDFKSNCPPVDLSQFRLDFLAYIAGISPSLHMLDTTHDLSQTLVEQARAGNSSNYYIAAIRGCSNKRFFCTQNGDFGIGPRAAQVGDHVVLLYGSNAPCVLRPKGSYYQFVGECYLHQHMRGEAIEMVTRGLSVVEEFELR